MSLECSECERDLRGGHAPSCSRHPLQRHRNPKVLNVIAKITDACRGSKGNRPDYSFSLSTEEGSLLLAEIDRLNDVELLIPRTKCH